eukprot:scaffold21802_cov132-Isochrysis_galbana.AAC.8
MPPFMRVLRAASAASTASRPWARIAPSPDPPSPVTMNWTSDDSSGASRATPPVPTACSHSRWHTCAHHILHALGGRASPNTHQNRREPIFQHGGRVHSAHGPPRSLQLARVQPRQNRIAAPAERRERLCLGRLVVRCRGGHRAQVDLSGDLGIEPLAQFPAGACAAVRLQLNQPGMSFDRVEPLATVLALREAHHSVPFAQQPGGVIQHASRTLG